MLQVYDDDISDHTFHPPEQNLTIEELSSSIEYHLSLNPLYGSIEASTMRFKGDIQGVEIQILLDSRSSDNFWQPRIAHYLKIPIHSADKCPVLMGNGSKWNSRGYIPYLPISLQGHMLHVLVYLLSFTGASLVLGALWLKTLGSHVDDYDALSIIFYLQNSFITFHGDKSPFLGQAQFHHILRLHNTYSIDTSFMLQFSTIARHDPTTIYLLSDLLAILQSFLALFMDVFGEPKGLPPPREQEHTVLVDLMP